MSDMIIMQGLPGSGKSTFVKKEIINSGDKRYQLVCRDDLRFAFGVKYGEMNYSLEPIIAAISHSMIRAQLNRGLNVVVDETNTSVKNVGELIKIAEEYDADVWIYRMVTPFETCVERRCSDGRFPEDAIKRMNGQLREWDNIFDDRIKGIIEVKGY